MTEDNVNNYLEGTLYFQMNPTGKRDALQLDKTKKINDFNVLITELLEAQILSTIIKKDGKSPEDLQKL